MSNVRHVQSYSGGKTSDRKVQDLLPGHLVVYKINGRMLGEVVRSVAPVPTDPRYVAVRYYGRDVDMHYAYDSTVRVADPVRS